MWNDYQNGQRFVIRLKARKTLDGQGFVGLAPDSPGLTVAATADNEAAATVYTSAAGQVDGVTTPGQYEPPAAGHCRLREFDPVAHPGTVEVHLPAERMAVAGARYINVTVSGVAGLSDCDGVIPLRGYDPYDRTALGLAAFAALANAFVPGVVSAVTNEGLFTVTFPGAAPDPAVLAGLFCLFQTAPRAPMKRQITTAVSVSPTAVRLGFDVPFPVAPVVNDAVGVG